MWHFLQKKPSLTCIFFRTSESLFDFCLNVYECVVCLEYMHPPIPRCKMGHNYCNKCREKIERCPICRSEHANKDDYLISKFHSYLRFPCKFKEMGCSLTFFGNELQMHQDNCMVNWKRCPINSFDYCTWYGPKNAIAQHCAEIHADSFYCGRRVSYPWQNLVELSNGMCKNFLIFAYDRVFHCKAEADAEVEGVITISVKDLECENGFSGFFFMVSLLLKCKLHNRSKTAEYLQHCGFSGLDGVERKKSITLYHYVLRQLCEETDLNCFIEIWRMNHFTQWQMATGMSDRP